MKSSLEIPHVHSGVAEFGELLFAIVTTILLVSLLFLAFTGDLGGFNGVLWDANLAP